MKLISQRILNTLAIGLIWKMDDDECKAEFRFLKNDIYTLCEVLDFPEEIHCTTGFKVPGLCALCVPLKRFACPC